MCRRGQSVTVYRSVICTSVSFVLVAQRKLAWFHACVQFHCVDLFVRAHFLDLTVIHLEMPTDFKEIIIIISIHEYPDI